MLLCRTDVVVSMSIDSYVNRVRQMWVFFCELLAVDSVVVVDRCSRVPVDRFGLVYVDRCSRSSVDRHQCDPPKLIKVSTSKSPSCSFSSFSTCQKSSSMMAFTWCFITSSPTALVEASCLLTTSPVSTTCISSFFT